jgi:hypothetical protein
VSAKCFRISHVACKSDENIKVKLALTLHCELPRTRLSECLSPFIAATTDFIKVKLALTLPCELPRTRLSECLSPFIAATTDFWDVMSLLLQTRTTVTEESAASMFVYFPED